jgi:hypothetical protein
LLRKAKHTIYSFNGSTGTAVDELLTQQNYLAGKLAGMSEEQLLENKKNKPKVIYFYKELFRYNL